MTLKPHQLSRQKLAKRARDAIALASGTTPEHLRKTPSQKHSEAGKARERRRAGVKNAEAPVPSDCRECPLDKACQNNHDLAKCSYNSVVVRCGQCGQKVRIRIVPGKEWERCPVCMGG